MISATRSGEVYYVKPNIPSQDKCPESELCMTLNEYIEYQYIYDEKPVATIVFLKGSHYVTTETINNDFGSPVNSDNLHIVGNGHTNDVIIEGLQREKKRVPVEKQHAPASILEAIAEGTKMMETLLDQSKAVEQRTGGIGDDTVDAVAEGYKIIESLSGRPRTRGAVGTRKERRGEDDLE